MGKYIDGSGLSHFMGIIKGALSGKVDVESGKGLSTNDYTTTEKNKLAGIASGAEVNVQSDWNQSTSTADDYIKNKPTIPSANTTATNIKMDGTQSAGSLASFAKADHVHPSDTSRVPTTRTVNGKALSADVTVYSEDILLFSGSPDSVYDTFEAYEIAMGEIADNVNGKVDKVEGKGLSTNDYTTTEKNKLAGIATGAEVNVQSDWNQTTTTADDYIKNKPTLGSAAAKTAGSAAGNVPLVGTALGSTANKIVVTTAAGALAPSSYSVGAAAAKGVDTSITAGSTSTDVPTTAAVVNYMTTVAGALTYQGTVGTGGTVTDLPANHTKGWYYVVKTAGTYAGYVCEVGDMLICNTSGTTASNAHWDAVQSNIEVLSNSEIDALWAAA